MSEGRIPRRFIDDLLQRVDIVDLIDSYLPLKKTGTNFVARCPFHNEKTPSFSVNRNKQFYHCFGCGASGNAITFVMEFSRLDFVEAIEELATYAGVEVPRDSDNSRKDNDLNRLYGLMEQAALFYTEQLRVPEGAKALDYLRGRGIGDSVMRTYRLGYAPNAWQALTNRFDATALEAVGLAVKKDARRIYDRFRGRIMFPIRDKRGRIVGFGGRVMDDSTPKYLNSPETPLFHKSKELYGLYELLVINPKPEQILLVEGYMDVIALAEQGITNAVAALGTAVTQAHIDLLFRNTAELIFCFDGDRAGKEAVWRALEAALPCLRDGRQVRIMLLPQSEDPDSLVRKEGVADFHARLQDAAVLSDFFFAEIGKGLKLASLEAKAQLAAKARPYLEKLPAGFFRDMMFNRLKELSQAGPLDILQNKATLSPDMRPSSRDGRSRMTAARMVAALLVQNPEMANRPELKEIDLQAISGAGAEMFREIVIAIWAQKPLNTAVLMENFRGSAAEKPIKALAFLDLQVSEDELETVFCDALIKLRIQIAESEVERLLAQPLQTAQEKENLRKLYRVIAELKKADTKL